ncbi:hypothetical protein [Bacillus sp. J14TS2]|uniref:hypothetical protein n=1 Tax=Bacillus sp. J14TS2 TaxID=2807188 RepID=UPI001BB37B77|nr:hypothetical protein [Bacillus sp. J14TS2]
MLIQIISSQIVFQGKLIPEFYQVLGNWLPGTYYADEIYKILFGGSSLASSIRFLFIMVAVFLAVTAIAFLIRKNLFLNNKTKSNLIRIRGIANILIKSYAKEFPD